MAGTEAEATGKGFMKTIREGDEIIVFNNGPSGIMGDLHLVIRVFAEPDKDGNIALLADEFGGDRKLHRNTKWERIEGGNAGA